MNFAPKEEDRITKEQMKILIVVAVVVILVLALLALAIGEIFVWFLNSVN